jgi:hypothetical protein
MDYVALTSVSSSIFLRIRWQFNKIYYSFSARQQKSDNSMPSLEIHRRSACVSTSRNIRKWPLSRSEALPALTKRAVHVKWVAEHVENWPFVSNHRSPFHLRSTFAQTTETATQPLQHASGPSKTTAKQTSDCVCLSEIWEAQQNNRQSVNGDEAHYTSSAWTTPKLLFTSSRLIM